MAAQPLTTGGKPPSSADFNQILNSISLATAKHNTILQSLRAKRQAVNVPTSPAGKTGFSTPRARTHPNNPSESVPDDAELRVEPLNAGIGYKLSKEERESRNATRDLERRLLGKRGREGEAKGRAGRRVVNDESDEDEGRSGLGRSKRAKVGSADGSGTQGASPGQITRIDSSDDRGEMAKTVTTVESDIRSEHKNTNDAGGEVGEAMPAADSAMTADATCTIDEEDKTGLDKRKRKKNKKKPRQASSMNT
jgi:hypothetical protein